jgi:hypothetical protein
MKRRHHKPFTVVEKSVLISALNDQIKSDRREAERTPIFKGYAERNIVFREALIEKVEED